MNYWNFWMNNWQTSLILPFLWICAFPAFGQSIYYSIDSSDHFLVQKNKEVVNYYLGKGHPQPKTSVLLSMVVPGAGQIYNRQAWKLPFIYGGYGLLLKNLSENRSLFKSFDRAFRQSVAGEPHEYERFNLSSDALRSYRDQYRKNVELTYIGMAAVYVVTLLDAFVSAHLSTFDVSEDLSLFIPESGTMAPLSIGVAYRF